MNIKIKRILLFIRVCDIDIKKYKIYDYTIISVYILSSDGKVVLIRREIYIIDNLSTKALIEINIIKSKDIILDISRDLIIIDFYKAL